MIFLGGSGSRGVLGSRLFGCWLFSVVFKVGLGIEESDLYHCIWLRK